MLQKILHNKLAWFCIIVFELLFLGGALLVLHGRPSVELNYTQDDLIDNFGAPGFYLDKSYSSAYVATPEFSLPKGFYTLEAECVYNGSTRIEVLYSDNQFNGNVSDMINPSDYSNISCDFRVKYSGRKMRVQGRLGGDAGENDYILIRNIRIISSPLTMRNMLFRIVVFFAVMDLLLFGICHREYIRISEETKLHIKILILLIIVISMPLMVNYLFMDMHDHQFNLARIEGIKEELLNGEFPIRIQSFWLHGHGYPSSIFYGDILLYIPAILRIFGVSVQAAYNFYVLLINTVTVFLAYYCFSKMWTARIGLICTIVFSLNIYRLFDIYTRMAVGEYTAILFMPLVLYGLWRIYTLPEESEEYRRSWIPLTAGCIGIFLSHMLSTEMTAIFIILSIIILWKKTFRKNTLVVLIKAAVFTVLLSVWFLVPFLDYMASGTYHINNPLGYSPYHLEERGIFPAQLFMNVYSVLQGTTPITNGAAFDMPLTVGMASMLVLAGWFVFCCGKKREMSEKKEEYLAVLLSLLCLGMTMYFFPYTWLADKFPILKMVIRSIQYPWRFFSIAGVLLAWLLGIILHKEWIDRKKKQIFASILIMIAFWQGISYMSGVLNEARVMQIFQKVSPMGIEGGEYLPVDWEENYQISDYTENYIDQLTYAENTISVSEWHRDKGTVIVSLTNNGDETAQIEVPLISYKGYHAITDSGDELSISQGVSGRISVSVPTGFSGSFKVEFKEPWYWRMSELISLITLLCLVLYPYVKNHVRKKQETDCFYEI